MIQDILHQLADVYVSLVEEEKRLEMKDTGGDTRLLELEARADAAEAEINRLSTLLKLNPCGHPVCATGGVPDFVNDDPTQPQTLYCRWCADIDNEREACAQIADTTGEEAGNSWEAVGEVARYIADAIRARGQG